MEGSQKTKKFINGVDSCVDDNIKGYIALHPGLQLLDGHRVILRHDIEQFKTSGKVCVLTGGGSGHEPAFAGSFEGIGKLVMYLYDKIEKEDSKIVKYVNFIEYPNLLA